MKYPLASTSALVFALVLSACATDGKQTDAKATPGMQTEQKGAVTPKGDAAASVTISTVTATVEAIDLATRMVTVVGPEGNAFVLQAGEKVRNLDQVKVGDKVKVEYYEGLVAELNAPGASPKEVTMTDAMIKAAPGERPAGAVGEATTATVVIEYVDAVRHVVRFKGPLGKSRIVKVVKPEFRTMLKSLKPGDQVTLTYFEAVAVGVEPAN
jgi:hypothetical protein